MELEELMRMSGALRDVLPLEILPEADRRELAQTMRARTIRGGEVLYHQGDDGSDAFVVFSGLVKLALIAEDGQEALVALAGRGELFGELALFREGPRDATATAVLAATVLQLSRDACWRVLKRNAAAQEWMFAHLAETIARLTSKYEDVVFLDVPSRLAKYLLELDRSGTDLPISQEELAAAIASTRVTVNKLLADFQERGLIKVQRRHVQVLDLPLLRRQVQV